MQLICKWKFIAQSCPALWDPMDCSLPKSSFHGILQAREYWNGLPFPSPGDLPDLGVEPGLLHCRQILYQLSHQGSNSFSTPKFSYAKLNCFMDFPGGASGKESTCQCRRSRKQGVISESERSPGEGNGNPFQHSCLENSMDRGAWQATIHGVPKSQAWLSNWTTILPKPPTDSMQWLIKIKIEFFTEIEKNKIYQRLFISCP